MTGLDLKKQKDYVNYGEFCNEVDSIAFRVINRYVSKNWWMMQWKEEIYICSKLVHWICIKIALA